MNTKIGPCCILLASLTLMMACQTVDEKKYTVTGTITGFPSGSKIYLKSLATDAVFDSTIIKKNVFKMEGRLASPPEQVWLSSRIGEQFVYTNLLMGNDDITIEGDIADFPWSLTIKGSKVQEEFNQVQNLIRDYLIRRDTLVRGYFKLSTEHQKKTAAVFWNEIRNIDSLTDATRIKYIKSHPNTYASIIELNYLKNSLPKDTVKKIYEGYSSQIKKSKYAKVIEVYLKEDISKIGDSFHDFNGLNQHAENITFSKIRGSYTLLDFTAAYCTPCMQAAEELLMVDSLYSGPLKIVSFSMDPKKEVWLKSVERDRVGWNSIWDGKGRYSETSIKYGIQAIPTYILIDPQGIIIDKWSGYERNSLIKRLKKNVNQ